MLKQTCVLWAGECGASHAAWIRLHKNASTLDCLSVCLSTFARHSFLSYFLSFQTFLSYFVRMLQIFHVLSVLIISFRSSSSGIMVSMSLCMLGITWVPLLPARALIGQLESALITLDDDDLMCWNDA